MNHCTHLMASANPASSAALLLQEVGPQRAGCRGSQATRPQRIWTMFAGETAAIPHPAALVPSGLRLELPSVKRIQTGGFDPSHPCGDAAGWQHGGFFGLRQPEGVRSELLRVETQAHPPCELTPDRGPASEAEAWTKWAKVHRVQ